MMNRDDFDPDFLVRLEAAIRARDAHELPSGELAFRCVRPEEHEHGDAHSSCRWNRTKAVFNCDVCGVHGGAVDLARWLNVQLPERAHATAPDLATFAHERHLPLEVLRRFGVQPTVWNGRPALRYPTQLGVDRIKYTDKQRPKYIWTAKGKGRTHWYGGQSLALSSAGGRTLYIVNGEPSVWACAAREVPAVCLCGEGARPSAKLIAELKTKLAAAGVTELAIRVVYDADGAGRKGAAKVVDALRAGGFVDVVGLDLAPVLEGIEKGDVDDLHRVVGDGLAAALAALPTFGDVEGARSAVAETTGKPAGTAPASGAKVSQATELLELASDLELFRTPEAEPTAFCRLVVDDHREVYRVPSRAVRALLARRYYGEHRRAVRGQALAEALAVLEARALGDGEARPVATRIAEHDGAIYLDLCDPAWRVVEVTSDGWRIVTDAPVRFRRARGMLPLPEPVCGGSVERLRDFLHVPDDDAWRLVVAWLLAALRPRGPYPLLALHGEQGAAKSTATRVLRLLVDPNAAALRASPREPRDLMIAATNGWVIALDNLSHLAPWLSDALCRLSTGGGFATRELFSDADETLFDAMRPVVLNGIEEVATRGDLADRAVLITLPPVGDDCRRTEEEFWRAFEGARPGLLGAFLNVVARGLHELPRTRLDRLPRMADFARWVTACEAALGWEAGTFCRTYVDARRAANEVTLEANAVGTALMEYMAAREGWTGTTKDLLVALGACVGDDVRRDRRRWPQSARGLSGALRRLGPALRAVGIIATWYREPGGPRKRTICLRWQEGGFDRPNRPDRPNASTGVAEAGTVGDGPGTVAGRSGTGTQTENATPGVARDGGDGRDGSIPTPNGWGEV
ncbi:MAG: hypothetical protein E6J71_06895 [Deltaproteobacteria bacterium]|nr:MAG: hypothetical protein E6J71_06895 [Deltaproteobacteria bacterium]